MLNLLENYLINIQFIKDTKSKNINDFGTITSTDNQNGVKLNHLTNQQVDRPQVDYERIRRISIGSRHS